jgi:hypothetical protein
MSFQKSRGKNKVHWASTGHETQFSSKFGAKPSLPCPCFSWTPSPNHFCCFALCIVAINVLAPRAFNAESQYFIPWFNKISWLCVQQPGGDEASNEGCNSGPTGDDFMDKYINVSPKFTFNDQFWRPPPPPPALFYFKVIPFCLRTYVPWNNGTCFLISVRLESWLSSWFGGHFFFVFSLFLMELDIGRFCSSFRGPHYPITIIGSTLLHDCKQWGVCFFCVW